MKTCPFCAEEIQDAAIVCKHCGRELKGFTAPVVTPPPLPVKKKTSPAAIGCLGILGILFLMTFIGNLTRSSSSRSASTSTDAARSSAQQAPSRVSEPELALIASRGYPSSGRSFFHVEGQVRNLTDQPLKSVMAVTTWYDEKDNFVKTAEALIDFNPILPGQTSPFSTITTGNPAMSRYTVEFKRIFGGTINTRDDRKSK